ncbi:MAG: hypothetical protein IIT53_03480 [Fibrobacter sp.]|nr:hypothetical protein [Fibrobacter sp.]
MNMSKKTNTPVKNALSAIWSAILCACAVMLATGCGDSDRLAGTSEEGNELAEHISSSSDEVSSSSMMLSSSLGQDGQKPIPSSSSRIASSSSVKSSSSSEIREPFEVSSSSAKGETHTPPIYEREPKPGSLDSYLVQFNLKSDVLDKGLLSMKVDYSKDANPKEPLPPSASATEFDGPWPHKFVKQNIYVLYNYFPTAAEEYSEIVDSIMKGSLDANCGLYMFNVYEDGKSAGFVLAEIAKDTIKVLDIQAENCKAVPSGSMVRSLFYYCGELDSRPEVVHIPVENTLSGSCPKIKTEDEWVREKTQVSIK